MTALSQTQTTNRRGFLRLMALGTAGLVTARVLGATETAIEQATVPQFEKDTHAVLKHGLEDVAKVYSVVMYMANREPVWFDRPPCKDGRYRWIVTIGKAFGVLVAEKTGAHFKEVTAFIANQDYAKKVNDECDNGFGYAQEGQHAQKGASS